MVYYDHDRIKSVLVHQEVGHEINPNLAKKAGAGRSDRKKRRLDWVCQYFKLLTNSTAGHVIPNKGLQARPPIRKFNTPRCSQGARVSCYWRVMMIRNDLLSQVEIVRDI